MPPPSPKWCPFRVDGAHIACFAPNHPDRSRDVLLVFERAGKPEALEAPIRFLAELPAPPASRPDPDGLVVLTNDRGGMARLRVDFGSIRSKYDCVLGANLHPTLPVDRHVLVKRVRLWLNADGFISPLDRLNLVGFDPGPPAVWHFRANAGDARTVELRVEATMPPGRNTTLFRFTRPAADPDLDASLVIRVDLEDRSFHAETRRNPGADHHFTSHCRSLPGHIGFAFAPAPDRRLEVRLESGAYHPQPEWSEHIPHPVEASRGQVAEGDAFSPGWFEIRLAPGQSATLALEAEPAPTPTPPARAATAANDPFAETRIAVDRAVARLPLAAADPFARRLALAAAAFVVRRGSGRTVIAGYPWFLDWGRDTLIAARGLLAGGWHKEVVEILETFGRFADRGTLPNSIHGENAANRDTSDAPLWYALAVEDAARVLGSELLRRTVTPKGPSLLEVVRSLADGYLAGTPNGIRVDPESALVWSPSHFTWMDTNHPAGTPREGYPVEIQALWIRTLRFLEHTDPGQAPRWKALAENALTSFRRLFWLPRQRWFGDVLLGPAHRRPGACQPDTALRCNGLLAVTLGLADPDQARATVDAALHHLLVPGAVRSLAPLPTSPPLPIHGPAGTLLNDPNNPYWGRYEGDEDTRRKPAYHNGTAWTWFLPVLAEALAEAWNWHPDALRTARAIVGSTGSLIDSGCLGQLPEILDGDTPHQQRGCDAQAWSVTECLRVWLRLNPTSTDGTPARRRGPRA
jgi:starch synthase (maltosyl-transferring)